MTLKAAVILLLISSIFFSGCLAGKEMKYQALAQVIYDRKVLESTDVVITVRG